MRAVRPVTEKEIEAILERDAAAEKAVKRARAAETETVRRQRAADAAAHEKHRQKLLVDLANEKENFGATVEAASVAARSFAKSAAEAFVSIDRFNQSMRALDKPGCQVNAQELEKTLAAKLSWAISTALGRHAPRWFGGIELHGGFYAKAVEDWRTEEEKTLADAIAEATHIKPEIENGEVSGSDDDED